MSPENHEYHSIFEQEEEKLIKNIRLALGILYIGFLITLPFVCYYCDESQHITKCP